jgi:hypothetical protein
LAATSCRIALWLRVSESEGLRRRAGDWPNPVRRRSMSKTGIGVGRDLGVGLLPIAMSAFLSGLVSTQRDHRVDVRSATSREEAGQHRDQHQKNRDPYERRRIRRRDSIESSLDIHRRRPR